MRKLLIVLLVIAGFILLTVKVSVILFTNFMCSNEVIAEYVSLNGKRKAVIFDRGCGVGSGISTQVSVISKTEKLKNKSGNIFIKKGRGNVKAVWLDDKVLMIQYTDALKIFKQKNKYKGIYIKYELVNF